MCIDSKRLAWHCSTLRALALNALLGMKPNCDILASQRPFVNPFAYSMPASSVCLRNFFFFSFWPKSSICSFSLLPQLHFEYKKKIQRASASHVYIYFGRNVDTVKSFFREHFNTSSHWALSKFQFGTMAIEVQNLHFNSCLIFNEIAFYNGFWATNLVYVSSNVSRRHIPKQLNAWMNNVVMKFNKKRGFIIFRWTIFPAHQNSSVRAMERRRIACLNQ